MPNIYRKELISAWEQAEISDGKQKLYESYEDGIEAVFRCFHSHKQKKKQLFFVGNGGSAAIAAHMTADFMKNGGMRTVSLYSGSVLTCMGNDYGYGDIFSRPLGLLGNEEDLLVAISSSGQSENILRAVQMAREKHMQVITLSGFQKDNPLRSLGELNIFIPSAKYGIVESIHNIILQQLVDMLLEKDGLTFENEC